MNARTIRRAIERKAEKQARKEAARDTAALSSQDFAQPRLDANRRNALLSTGPVTAEGKARSSRNALKTGLTGRTVLLANEDAALYEHHVRSFFAELHPVGDRETELVQSIADSKWRLARIPGLEFALYALGRNQFAEEFQNLPTAEAAALIEARTFLAFQKQLNNLSVQEARLRRQCEKDSAELNRLQELRSASERIAARQTTPARGVAPLAAQEPSVGFEFATSDVEDRLPFQSDPLSLPQAA